MRYKVVLHQVSSITVLIAADTPEDAVALVLRSARAGEYRVAFAALPPNEGNPSYDVLREDVLPFPTDAVPGVVRGSAR